MQGLPLAAATTAADLELARVSDPRALRPAWSRLAARGGNLFGTLEWLSLWWRHFGRGRLEVWRLGAAAAPEALLPMCLHDGQLSFLGAPHGDELGPVTVGRGRAEAARALGQILDRGRLPWRRFVAEDLPADVPWEQATGAAITRRTASPVLRLGDGGWAGYLESRSRNFRAQVRSRERRLARAHRASIRVADDPRRLERDLDVLFSLHRARWGRRPRGFAGAAEPFHRDFAAVALRRGWLRLRFLEIDGAPAAAQLNFRFAGSEWFYQGGRDPSFDRWSPGFVLQLHAIRSSFEDGLTAYRFLRGDEAYKRRLASHDPGLLSLRLDR